MNFTRQVHPTIIERAAAHTCLRIMDGPTGINAHGFAFAHRDSDPEDVARAGANKLLGVLPGRQHATELLALLHQMNA
jgi:hypothetical protein